MYADSSSVGHPMYNFIYSDDLENLAFCMSGSDNFIMLTWDKDREKYIYYNNEHIFAIIERK